MNDARNAEGHIDAAKVARHAGRMIEQLPAVSDVNRVGAGLPASPAALPGGIVRRLTIPVGKGQARAPPGQPRPGPGRYPTQPR